jgi:hypothetical protein
VKRREPRSRAVGSGDTTHEKSIARLTSGVCTIRKGGARELNTSTGEVASGASVWSSLRLHVASASEEGAIPV